MDFFSMLLNKVMNPSSGGSFDICAYITQGSLFKHAKSFPVKAVVNLPNVASLYQAFSYWDTEPIPVVEDLTINASQVTNITQMFVFNLGVKKVVLGVPDEVESLDSAFAQAKKIEEIVFNFSTKNIVKWASVFSTCNALKKIVGVLDFSSATNVQYMFASCNSLEEVTFEPNTLSLSISLQSCGKLTSESVQSIIDGLATVETAQTLALNSAVLSQLTDEQWLIAEEKNWIIS